MNNRSESQNEWLKSNPFTQKFKRLSPSEWEFSSNSPEESLELASFMGSRALPGDMYALEGGLGAGKTLFSRGFAEGLGIQEPVTSPTFPIIQEYDHEPPLYHMDLYRLSDSDDVIETGAEELWSGSGVTLIEWPDRAEDILPPDCIRIRIQIGGPESRTIRISASPQRMELLEKQLSRKAGSEHPGTSAD